MASAIQYFRIFAFLLISTAVIADVALSQVPIPVIESASYPGSSSGTDFSGAPPAVIVKVRGSNFAMRDQVFPNISHSYEAQAAIEFQQIKISFRTYVLSQSELFFTVPLGVPCGDYRLFVTNADVVFSGSGTLPSNTITFKIACGPGGGTAEPARPEITRIAPDEARAGDQVSVIGRNFSFPIESFSGAYPFITISGVDVEAEWVSITQVRFVIPANIPCGELQPVQITNLATTFTQGVLTPGGGINLPETIEIASTQVPLLIRCSGAQQPPAQPPVPPPATTGSLADLDSDDDCHLSDNEFFRAVDLWVAASIEDQLFFLAVDAWVGQVNICNASASLKNPAFKYGLLAKSHLLFVAAPDSNIESLRVEVFDQRGSLVASNRGHVRSIRLSLSRFDGNALANGVYWVRLLAWSSNGQLILSDLKKIVVLR